MKTPEHWLAILLNNKSDGISSESLLRALILDVQTDAYHAGQLAGIQIGKETALKTIEEVFSKTAERSEKV